MENKYNKTVLIGRYGRTEHETKIIGTGSSAENEKGYEGVAQYKWM